MEKPAMRHQDWFMLLSLGNFKFTMVGFYMVGLITILKQSGFDLNQLSWVYLLAAVELIKVLFSLLIERFRFERYGHFRSWLVLSTVLMFFALVLLYGIDVKTQYGLLLVACFSLSIVSVFFGCATLGLNCALLSFNERGFGGVIQVVAARLGKVVGGGVLLLVYQHYGYHAAIAMMMALSTLMLLQLLFYREPINSHQQHQVGYSWAQLCARIVSFWQQDFVGWRWFVLLFFSCIPYGLVATTFIPKLSDTGWNAGQVGTVLAIYVPIACMVAAPLAGWLSRRFSRYALVLGILLTQFLILLSFVFVDGLTTYYQNMIIVLIVALSMGYTMLLPIVMALFMDKASEQWATLDSALQFTAMIGGAYIAGFLALRLANALGYGVVYVSAAIVAGVLPLLAWRFGQKLF